MTIKETGLLIALKMEKISLKFVFSMLNAAGNRAKQQSIART